MVEDLVVVTGASGYVAGHCILKLLDAGYRVRGTLQSMRRAPEVAAWIRRARNGVEAGSALSFVEAGLTDSTSWHSALADARYVLHVASPVPSRLPRHADELIVPAREGTLNVLRAAVAAGVERVVQTSSSAAVTNGRDDPGAHMFTEEDWTDESHPDNTPYTRSKTIAERAAWAELALNPSRLEWVTIMPSLVLGPVLDKDASASVQVVAKLLRGELPGCPPLGWSVVDVRDIADLHVRAMRAPDARGQRYIGAGPFLWMADIARVLREQAPEFSAKVPTRKLPGWLMKLVALMDAEVRGQVSEIGKVRRLTSQKAISELGWSLTPVEATLRDTARSLSSVGAIG